MNTIKIDPLAVGPENYPRYQLLLDRWVKTFAFKLVLLPLSLAVYFARSRVKSWFKPGRWQVDWSHLMVLILVPLFFIYRLPFIWMRVLNQPFFSLLVFYNLFCAFYKEPHHLQAELPDTGQSSPE